MSRIRRLSIRGIRNFGDDTDETIIRFNRPLTLILGPNGTGKTTIIEALRFATTGEFPPGSDRGKSFIHDPNLSKATSVRGSVKAELYDQEDNTYVIARTIEATKSHNAIKFKTLDATLSRRKRGSNQTTSLSHRCADVDLEIPYILGVSKPILNYVIFCHQEDLHWPFQDGKKLRERFDEIFDSARFNKALENLGQQSKEMHQEAKTLNAEHQACEVTLRITKDKEAKRDEQRRRLRNAIEKVQEVDETLKPIYHKLEKMEAVDSDYRNLQTEQDKKKLEYEMCAQQAASLRENIHEVFEGSTEELKKEIESYDDLLFRSTAEIAELEESIAQATEEETELSGELSKEMITLGTLRQQLTDKAQRIRTRDRILKDTLESFNLPGLESNPEPEVVAECLDRLKAKMGELEQRAERNQRTRSEKVEALQESLAKLRSQASVVDSELKVKMEELQRIGSTELVAVRGQIKELSSASAKLDTLDSKLSEAKSRVEQLTARLDLEAGRRQVQENLAERDRLESELSKAEAELDEVRKDSSLHSELDIQRSALRSKEDEVRRLRKSMEDSVHDLHGLLDLPDEPDRKIRNDLDKVQNALTEELQKVNLEAQAKERLVAGLEASLRHSEREVARMEKEVEADKQRVSTICHYKDFEEMLELQSRKVKDLQDQRGIYAHQTAAYKEYMRQLKKSDPCCPICHRGFEERRAVENLLREMATEMEAHPSKLKSCESELKVQQTKYDAMLQLRPVVDRINQTEETELEKLRSELSKTRRSLTEAKATIAELESRKSGPEQKLSRCRALSGDAVVWDKCVDEILRLRGTIEGYQIRLAAAGTKIRRSVHEIQSEVDSLKSRLKSLRDETEDLQSKMTAVTDQLQSAKEVHNGLLEERLRVADNLSRLEQLKDKEKTLQGRLETLGESCSELEDQGALLAVEVAEKTSVIRELKKENSSKSENERHLLLDASKRLSDLNTLQTEIDHPNRRSLDELVTKSEDRLKTLKRGLQELSDRKSSALAAISSLKVKVSGEESQKRELVDNLTLRKVQANLETLKSDWGAVKRRLEEINYKALVDQRAELKNKEEALIRKRNMAKGSQEELERSIAQYEQELKSDEHRMARRRYKEKTIELTVHEQAIKNLQAYMKVFDMAMIEYHEERMSTLNKIMKEMWKMVYTGTDTSSIEIKTEPCERVGSGRRTYNYKLIQKKHGHEMDMKGRCSTGQKVLASIIIRLALAATFSRDCGVLALDEPTTNLDEENANSLATALATVVQMRSKQQKNFQLIVISHDEKFLMKLADLNNYGGFYELYRKNDGLTAIKKCHISGVKQEADEEETETQILQETIDPDRDDRQQQSKVGRMKKKRGSRDSDEETNPRKKKFFLDI